MTKILDQLDEHNDAARKAAGAVAENERAQAAATAALKAAEQALRSYQASGDIDEQHEADLVAAYTRLSNRRIQAPNGSEVDAVIFGQRAQLLRRQGEAEADRLSFVRANAEQLRDALLAEAAARRDEMRVAIGHLQTVANDWDATAARWSPLIDKRNTQIGLGLPPNAMPVNPVRGMLERIEIILSNEPIVPAPRQLQQSQDLVIDYRTPAGAAQ